MLGSPRKKHASEAAAVGGGAAAAAAYKDKHEQVLRIAASDVAAVAGYHEWVDVRELFLERLLYQDLDHLLRIDAENVGIEVEDRWQRSERLLAKAGNGELRAVRKRAGDGAAVATVQDAQALRNKARSLLKEAEGKKKLSEAEAKELENDLRHDINTQFGTRNENFALAVYERRSGTEVICSNERIMVWPFPGSKISGDGVPDGALEPPTELSKGWTKRESRGGALRSTAAEETVFASAVARCLAQLRARGAAFERAGDGGAVPAPASSGTGGGDGRLDPASSTKGDDDNGVDRPREGEEEEDRMAASAVGGAGAGAEAAAEAGAGAGNGVLGGGAREMMDVDSPVSDVAADGAAKGSVKGGAGEGSGDGTGGGVKEVQPPPVRSALPEGSTTNPGEKRELVPGVPWPEWRGSYPSIAARSLEAGGVLPISPAGEAPELSQTATPVPSSSDGLSMVLPPAPAAGASLDNRAGDEHGGLWFPSSLTPRQQTMVKAAAGALGFCHDSVAGGTGGVHVVVREPSSALPSSPSQKRPVRLPVVAAVAAAALAAVAEAAALPSACSNTRSGSSFPQQQAANALPAAETDTEPGCGHVTPGHDSAGALAAATEQARGGRRGSRRGSMAVTKLATGPVPPGQPAAAAVADEEKRKGAPASSSSTDGGATTATTASEGGASSSTGSFNGTAAVAAAAAAAAAAPATSKARLKNVDSFGGDAVYAWGEGPAAAAAAALASPSETRERTEEISDGQEWSVWSRDPQAMSPPPSGVRGRAARDGSAVSTDIATGMELEPPSPSEALSPARRSGDDKAEESSRAETLRERRRNACFVVVGAVDGVAEEVTDAPEDAETWETRRVVVEVKNRMNKARNPPPLYDQIQLVTYMLMIGAPVGDLVQFVKTGDGKRGNGKRGGAPTKGARATADDVLVSRVELDCRAYRHRKHWEGTVLPRLYAFARMVYRFRGDDLLRWRFLLAAPEERREMLVECCPYLESVIPRRSAAASAAAAHPPPPLPPGPSTTSGLTTRDQQDNGRGAGTPATAASRDDVGGAAAGPGVVAPDAESTAAVGAAVEAGGNSCGGDESKCETGSSSRARSAVAVVVRDEGDGDECLQEDSACAPGEQNAEEVSRSGGGGGGGSTVTVLSQKSRLGGRFVEPLGGVAAAAAAAAAPADVPTSPARKKSKGGDAVAVDRPDAGQVQGR